MGFIRGMTNAQFEEGHGILLRIGSLRAARDSRRYLTPGEIQPVRELLWNLLDEKLTALEEKFKAL